MICDWNLPMNVLPLWKFLLSIYSDSGMHTVGILSVSVNTRKVAVMQDQCQGELERNHWTSTPILFMKHYNVQFLLLFFIFNFYYGLTLINKFGNYINWNDAQKGENTNILSSWEHSVYCLQSWSSLCCLPLEIILSVFLFLKRQLLYDCVDWSIEIWKGNPVRVGIQ